jgi:hypothetical protein
MIPRKRNGSETGIYGASDSPAAKRRKGTSVISLTSESSSSDSGSEYTPTTDPSDPGSDGGPGEKKEEKKEDTRCRTPSDASNAVDEAAVSNMLASVFHTRSPRASTEEAQCNGEMDTVEFTPLCVRPNSHCQSHIDVTVLETPVNGSPACVPGSVSDVIVLDRPPQNRLDLRAPKAQEREEKGVQTDIFPLSEPVARIQVQGPSHVGCLKPDEIKRHVADCGWTCLLFITCSADEYPWLILDVQRALRAEEEVKELKHRREWVADSVVKGSTDH